MKVARVQKVLKREARRRDKDMDKGTEEGRGEKWRWRRGRTERDGKTGWLSRARESG